MAVIDRDNGFKALQERLAAGPQHIGVGVDSRPHMPTGQPTDEIAMAHEYGLGDTPQRSFLRAWVDENEHAILQSLKYLSQRAVSGEITWGEMRRIFGVYAVEGVRARMMKEIPPPLLAKTVNRKKGPHPEIPLLDTMQMYDAVIYELETRL